MIVIDNNSYCYWCRDYRITLTSLAHGVVRVVVDVQFTFVVLLLLENYLVGSV